MRLLKSLALALVGFAASVAAQDESLTVELDKSSFTKFIKENDVVMTDCECSLPSVPAKVHICLPRREKAYQVLTCVTSLRSTLSHEAVSCCLLVFT